MAKTVACVLVNSRRLDYTNYVLYCTTKLQRVQNTLARVVTNTRRAEHIHPVLASLHWLPIKYRIDYKVATLGYKSRSTGSPAYHLPYVSDYMPTRQLRSSTQLLLVKPPVRTEIARRAFSQAAPAAWNSLPHEIRNERHTDDSGQFYELTTTDWLSSTDHVTVRSTNRLLHVDLRSVTKYI